MCDHMSESSASGSGRWRAELAAVQQNQGTITAIAQHRLLLDLLLPIMLILRFRPRGSNTPRAGPEPGNNPKTVKYAFSDCAARSSVSVHQ
jgi:hypothetical protein